MQITLAGDDEGPAGVLGQGVQHVVEEADAGLQEDGLRLAGLRGMAALCAVLDQLQHALVGVGRKGAAVEVESELDRRLVGVAREGGPPGGCRCC